MAFTLPVLEKCCFCIHVRIGALIIGYLSMFSSLTSFLGSVAAIVVVANYVARESQRPDPPHPPQDMAAGALRIYITYGLYMILYVYYFVISLLVVIGVHRNKPHLMRYYVNTVLFVLILTISLVVVTVVFMGVIAAMPLLCSSVVVFYCLLVVRSAYLEMVAENRPKEYEMNTIQTTQQAPLMA